MKTTLLALALSAGLTVAPALAFAQTAPQPQAAYVPSSFNRDVEALYGVFSFAAGGVSLGFAASEYIAVGTFLAFGPISFIVTGGALLAVGAWAFFDGIVNNPANGSNVRRNAVTNTSGGNVAPPKRDQGSANIGMHH